MALKCRLQCQRVNNSRQHAHIITLHPFDADIRQCLTPDEVSSAYDNGQLYTKIQHLMNILRKGIQYLRIKGFPIAGQRFTAQLQQDTFVHD